MRVIIAAGGTGGHINPALAVASKIKEHDSEADILFIGTKEKMEAKLVPAAGFPFKSISISGFKRGFSPKEIKENIHTVIKMLVSSAQAKRIITEFEPDIIIGFGGYVSGPVVRAGAKLGIKTAIHEQNAYPGVANKALAKMVDKVMLTVKDAIERMNCKNTPVVTGLPIRPEMLTVDRDFARAELSVGSDKKIILSMGGSLGAKAINEAMVELIAKKHNDPSLIFIHSTGQYGLWVPDALKEKGVDTRQAGNVNIREYIDDMARVLAAADIVICRAGASTLTEIQALGKASILIPSPNVTENHQYHNAMSLVRNDAAVLIEEKDLTGERLIKEVDSLLKNPDKIKKIGENARKMAITSSLDIIYTVIKELYDEK
ncbi:MAG TPA: undecaprenyldiphospho-muramoylpentapeptide beta-N-acetylglucosaminyltransferase [Oscillospiraceae bacterium]|nr:undecaprenyldiphospho-muramoylpentapeptide beta-N-acetylglucosaminyltransferase [Oscillospiraceae bacterium]